MTIGAVFYERERITEEPWEPGSPGCLCSDPSEEPRSLHSLWDTVCPIRKLLTGFVAPLWPNSQSTLLVDYNVLKCSVFVHKEQRAPTMHCSQSELKTMASRVYGLTMNHHVGARVPLGSWSSSRVPLSCSVHSPFPSATCFLFHCAQVPSSVVFLFLCSPHFCSSVTLCSVPEFSLVLGRSPMFYCFLFFSPQFLGHCWKNTHFILLLLNHQQNRRTTESRTFCLEVKC